MVDKLLQETIAKIENQSITVEDINKLISETTPESIRDRIRRRTLRNTSASHIDKPSGHQPLTLPSFTKRVAPKRKPSNQQNHGRSKIAHMHSTRTQRQNSIKEAILYVKDHMGKSLTECDTSDVEAATLVKVASKMMSIPNIDRDWLSSLIKKVQNG